MTEVNKMIVITDCMECPKVGKCGAWKKLTPKQKFTLKTGVGIGKFILKGCPLEDVDKNRELLIAFREFVNEDEEAHLYLPENIIDRFLN